jgi:hypothetical protein
VANNDMRSFSGLVGDLWRGTSQAVFWCTLIGMLFGAVATIGLLVFYIVMATPPPPTGPVGSTYRHPPTNYGFARLFIIFFLPAVVGGGVIGCFVGVLLDFIVGLLRGPQKKKPRGKKWVPERDGKPRPESPSPLDAGGDIRSPRQTGEHNIRRPDDHGYVQE